MEKTILGLTEEVTILGKNGRKKAIARIDTGATSSSLDFSLAAKLQLGPVTKSKTIKSALGILERPVITAKVKIGPSVLEGEFSLADRSKMMYSILIGQNILKKGKFLIDPTKGAQ